MSLKSVSGWKIITNQPSFKFDYYLNYMSSFGGTHFISSSTNSKLFIHLSRHHIKKVINWTNGVILMFLQAGDGFPALSMLQEMQSQRSRLESLLKQNDVIRQQLENSRLSSVKVIVTSSHNLLHSMGILFLFILLTKHYLALILFIYWKNVRFHTWDLFPNHLLYLNPL